MFYQAEKTSCSTLIDEKNLKQEPLLPSSNCNNLKSEITSNNKPEYTTLQSTLTPPSSASSSSSTSSTVSTKKYSTTNYTSSSSKRKLSDPTSKSTQNLHQKPICSEYLNSKCLLYIYYKGDMLSVIDDHFKKSFSTRTTKSVSTRKSRQKFNNSTNNAGVVGEKDSGHQNTWHQYGKASLSNLDLSGKRFIYFYKSSF